MNRNRLGRVSHVAGAGDLKRFLRIPVPKQSAEGRFIARSRRVLWIRRGALTAVLLFGLQSYLWTRIHDLPLDSMLMQQRYRLGYAPVPELVKILAGPFEMGEQDTKFRNRYREADRRFFGAPSRRSRSKQAFRLGKHEVTYSNTITSCGSSTVVGIARSSTAVRIATSRTRPPPKAAGVLVRS